MTRFFTELRRRRILPVAGAYLAAGFLAVEIVQFLLAQGNAPEWTSKLIAIAYVVGFPIVGWMSSQGKLGAVPELVLGATVIIASVIWISSFFTMWNGFLDRAREVGSADRSENTGGQQT